MDEIEQPRHRAAAVHSGLSDRLIAEQLSAAWVWGALDAPPPHHQFCVAMGSRVSHSPARWMTLREVVIEEDEIAVLGGMMVTTPARTVVDLVRSSATFDAAEIAAVRRLAVPLDEAAATIARRRNLPNKRVALHRLDLCR